MPIVHECSEPGCEILTMGEYCVEHEPVAAADDATLGDLAEVADLGGRLRALVRD